jgi:hypothetical protein
MKRIASGSLPFLFALTACMNSPAPQVPENSDDSSENDGKKAKDKDTDIAGSSNDSALGTNAAVVGTGPKAEHATVKDESDRKASPCGGAKIADLMAVISQTSCEVPKATPESLPQRDLKASLDIKVTTDAARVPPGARTNITVTFTNKGATDLPLDFVADPEPRFEVEAYTLKGARADKPAGNEPALPSNVTDQAAPERSIERVTLAPKGTAKLVVPWDAVKYKWASADRAKGALPGQHYPRDAAGPLPKGKYVVHVVMPLVGVSEGVDHEFTQPRAQVEVGGL